MIDPWVKYDDVEEKRNGYYVVYSPVFTGAEYASLVINIYEPDLLESIKLIAENELETWAFKYATPVMVLISDKTGSNKRTKELIGHYFLLGYAKNEQIISYWDEHPENKNPDFNLSKDNLAKIYSGMNFKTYEEVIEKQEVERKGMKLLLVLMTLWVCAIPALIAFFGWSNPVVSFMALIYSWYIAFKKGRKLWGFHNKSEKELEKEKEELEKEHHHYHCVRNPDAFLKLKCENFRNDRLEKDKAKVESMRN